MTKRIRLWSRASYFLRRRRWVALLLCAVLASVAWLLLALGRDYTKVVEVEVIPEVELPVNFALSDASRLPNVITLELRGGGWELLSFSFDSFFEKKPKLRIEVEKAWLDENGGWWHMEERGILQEILEAYPLLDSYYRFPDNGIRISLFPKEISFAYAPLKSQTMPVVFTSQWSFGEHENFLLTAQKMEPEEVEVYGVSYLLDSLISVQPVLETDTVPLRVDHVGVSEFKVALLEPDGFRLSPDSITVTAMVEELLFHQEKVTEIEIDNLPDGYRLRLFPSSVSVSYLAPKDTIKGNGKKIYAPITLYVDASEIAEGVQNQLLEVRPRVVPKFAYTLQIDPDKVEFILEEDKAESVE